MLSSLFYLLMLKSLYENIDTSKLLYNTHMNNIYYHEGSVVLIFQQLLHTYDEYNLFQDILKTFSS